MDRDSQKIAIHYKLISPTEYECKYCHTLITGSTKERALEDCNGHLELKHSEKL